MKKIIILFCTILILGGCSSQANDTETTICESKTSNNGITFMITMNLKHKDQRVLIQDQKSLITTENENLFTYANQAMENADFVEKTKGMKGVTYELKSDKDNFKIEENLVVDFMKVSNEDYKIVTNGQAETMDGEFYIDLEKTVSGLEAEGFTCALQ